MEVMQNKRKHKIWTARAIKTVVIYLLGFFLLFGKNHYAWYPGITSYKLRFSSSEDIVDPSFFSNAAYAVYFPMRELLSSYPVNLCNSRDRRLEHINQQRIKEALEAGSQ